MIRFALTLAAAALLLPGVAFAEDVAADEAAATTEAVAVDAQAADEAVVPAEGEDAEQVTK